MWFEVLQERNFQQQDSRTNYCCYCCLTNTAVAAVIVADLFLAAEYFAKVVVSVVAAVIEIVTVAEMEGVVFAVDDAEPAEPAETCLLHYSG